MALTLVINFFLQLTNSEIRKKDHVGSRNYLYLLIKFNFASTDFNYGIQLPSKIDYFHHFLFHIKNHQYFVLVQVKKLLFHIRFQIRPRSDSASHEMIRFQPPLPHPWYDQYLDFR